MTTYEVTGVDVYGKRFKRVYARLIDAKMIKTCTGDRCGNATLTDTARCFGGSGID